MKYFFEDWERISLKIKKSSRVFLFFDYDGTLTPIVSKPELAKFPPAVKKLIKKLKIRPKFTLAIISGRSLKDVKKLVGLKGIIYAGNHGMEIEGRGVKFLRPAFIDAVKPIIRKIRTSLEIELSDIKGARVEDKGVTMSVHYRLAKPRDKTLIKKRFNRIVGPFIDSKKVRISSGKEVLEVRPDINWDKGSSVAWLLKRKKGSLPFYVGDDVTDMDGFRAVKRKGISIFVGSSRRRTNADYFLKDPKDVEKFIEKLLES